jgi:hypothetical protein
VSAIRGTVESEREGPIQGPVQADDVVGIKLESKGPDKGDGAVKVIAEGSRVRRISVVDAPGGGHSVAGDVNGANEQFRDRNRNRERTLADGEPHHRI